MLLGLAAIGPVPLDALVFAPKELWSAILLVIGGGALALGLGHRLPPSGGRCAVAIMSPVRTGRRSPQGMLEGADGVLRRWPVAGLSLLVLVIMFIAAMLS